MSVNDPIILRYSESYGKYWLSQGRETFYDDDLYWIMFETPDDASTWAKEELGKEVIVEKGTQLGFGKGD